MVAINVDFQWITWRRLQHMFMFRSRGFVLRRGQFGQWAEIGLYNALEGSQGRRAIDDGYFARAASLA